MQDTSSSFCIELNWPIISCASKLYKDSFIGITDDWISRFVAPAITGAF